MFFLPWARKISHKRIRSAVFQHKPSAAAANSGCRAIRIFPFTVRVKIARKDARKRALGSIMESFSNWLPHSGGYFLMEAIFASFPGIVALLLFIVIRRARRRRYFRRHDFQEFTIRKQWREILSGALDSGFWRGDPMRREIVQDFLLRELDTAGPKDRSRFQEFMRANGLLDACIEQARKGRAWQRRNALVTLGATLMPEAIPTLAEALDDRQLESVLRPFADWDA